jgi:hypothetical protein
MNEKRRLLILRASEEVCGSETELIRSHSELIGIEVVTKSVSSEEEMRTILRENGAFDYFYLCTHGSREGFQLGDEIMSWSEFAGITCTTDCLKEGATFMLACCRGGLNIVAYDIFIGCPDIDFVCGPTAKTYPWDLTTGFVVFMHHLVVKHADPTHAAAKSTAATDFTFKCFDRVEVECQADFQRRRRTLYPDWEMNELGLSSDKY